MTLFSVRPKDTTIVNSKESILVLRPWLEGQGWQLGEDYHYLGWDADGNEQWCFPNKDHAMLFKLTFGG
jgi:hypothetical protein